ncbi:MAG: hypothetical protein JSU59_09960, partial [Nitrospirota bacterium]
MIGIRDLTKKHTLFRCSAFLIPAFIILSFLALSRLVWPQDDLAASGPRLTALLDRDSAEVGAVVVLTLSYQLPEGARLPEKPYIGGLEGLTVLEKTEEPGRVRSSLLVDRLGSWESQPFSLAYVDKENQTQSLTADPVSLKVLSNLGDKPEEARLRPIQGILPTEALWPKYLPWGSGILAFLLAAVAIASWRRRKRALGAPIEFEEAPHTRAQREIERLEAQELFEKGKVKEFYFRFTEILKYYLESIRGFPAAEFTTEEITRSIADEPDRVLLSLLREADLVK